MGAANATTDIYNLYQLNENKILDPGAGGTFNLRGRTLAYAEIASGTRKLPDNTPLGVDFRVYATGSVTLTNVAGTTVATLATGECADCTPLTTTTWAASIRTAGAIEINTAADVPIVDSNALTSTTTVEAALNQLFQLETNGVNEAITTVGAGTLTASSIVGGVITRSGSTAAYTDTTDTGTEIDAVVSDAGCPTSHSWFLFIRNTVAFAETIAGGTGVTVDGSSLVPPNSVGVFFVRRSGANTFTITGLGAMPQANVKDSQFNTSAAASPVTAAAGILTGARHVYWANTTAGAVTLNTRTATQLFGDIPNCHIGYNWLLTIISDADNTVTLAGGTGVTITGTATVATNVTKTFLCTFTSATAVTMQNVGSGTVDATA